MRKYNNVAQLRHLFGFKGFPRAFSLFVRDSREKVGSAHLPGICAFFRLNRQRHSFGTRGSQVQILPLRPRFRAFLSQLGQLPGQLPSSKVASAAPHAPRLGRALCPSLTPARYQPRARVGASPRAGPQKEQGPGACKATRPVRVNTDFQTDIDGPTLNPAVARRQIKTSVRRSG
jgi:hypothetical protein